MVIRVNDRDHPLITIDGSTYVKRVEVGVGIKNVKALGALESVHNQICQRGGKYLVGAFNEPLSQDGGDEDRSRKYTKEGD